MCAKVAIISGGTYGIGRAITLSLLRSNFSVVSFGVDERQTEEMRLLLQQLGLSAEIVTADVSNPSDVQRVVSATMDKYARVDLLCNNAAIRETGTLMQTDENMWDRTFAVNVRGMYLLTRCVLPRMLSQRSGAVINLASPSAYGAAGQIAYSSSKGAVLAFTKSLALDCLSYGVRVNAVVPGFTTTGMTEKTDAQIRAAISRRNVAGRTNTPEDIANVVCFLASEQASTITGAVWEVGAFHGQMAVAP